MRANTVTRTAMVCGALVLLCSLPGCTGAVAEQAPSQPTSAQTSQRGTSAEVSGRVPTPDDLQGT
jgi:hypothetical protein